MRELVEVREMLFGGELRLVRMNAHRRVDPVVFFRKRNRRAQPVRPSAAADGKQRRDARRASALKHRRAVLIELRKLQVRV